MSQTCLKDAPEDNITSLVYHPTKSNLLLASSWDQTLRLYNTTTHQLKVKIPHDSPIADSCFGHDYTVYSAALDGSLYSNDLYTGKKRFIGKHSLATRSICWSPNYDTLYSGSLDKSLIVWDVRGEGRPINKYTLHKTISSIDLQDNTLAVSLSHGEIHIYDIRKMDEPKKVINTTLRCMLKTVRVMPGGKGIACSSLEGRIELTSFGETGQDQTYAFKSHKRKRPDSQIVYPVNSLSFHPIYGTFASGGSDGIVTIWDGVNQRKLRQFSRYSEEISNVAFNCEGTQLAIASSYTYDYGNVLHNPDAIYIRHLNEVDYKPNPTASSSSVSKHSIPS